MKKKARNRKRVTCRGGLPPAPVRLLFCKVGKIIILYIISKENI